MDVELQILKHLARDTQPMVAFIDKYCVGYKDLFPEVWVVDIRHRGLGCDW